MRLDMNLMVIDKIGIINISRSKSKAIYDGINDII